VAAFLLIGAVSAQQMRNTVGTGTKPQPTVDADYSTYVPSNRDVILSEGFESGSTPTGWVFLKNGTAQSWQVVDALYSGGTPVVAPHSGGFFATNLWQETGGARDAWMISKAFNLTAGTQYTISWWMGLQGYQTEKDKIKVTLGTAQTIAAMSAGTVIYDNPGTTTVTCWTKMTFTHTPTTTGTYYLGFNAYTQANWGNDIDIDDVEITSPGGGTDVTITTEVTPAGAGSVTGGGTKPSGSNFTLTATANAGYTFEKWTPGNATTNPLQLTNVTASATYTANFKTSGGGCDPAKNINVVYSTDCSKATITWDPPAKGGKSPLIHAYNPNLTDCAELRSTTPATPVITQDDFKRTDPSRAILFNNGPLITHPGAGPGGVDVSAINDPYSTLYGSNVNKTLNYSIAEDFTLDAQSTIENFNFFSYQTSAGSTTSTITGAYVRIWSGEPGICGSTVIWGDLTTNRMASTNYSNINRTTLTALTNTDRRIMNVVATVNTVLNPGIYWVEWTLTGSLASGPWAPPVTVLGSPETGNAKQFTGTKWQPCSAAQDGVHAMAFIVNGTPTGTNKLIPKAPSPFTATPVGTQYKCNLQWTNPSIAFGGAPLTSITKMVLERDCEVIQEFTTATVGGVMNYTDNVPGNGVYTYSLYAVTPDGNGPRAFVTAFVGDPCSAEVIISGLDTYLDAWSWILYDVRSGYVYKGGGAESGKGGLSAGTHAANIYGDAKFEMWQHGTAGDNTALVTVKLDGVIVYQKTTPAIPVGFTANAALPCAGDPNPYDITYNVYRDDVKIASDIEATTFEDKTFDKNKPYTWKVVVNCPNGEESDPISKSLAACYTPLPPCKPVKNVNGVFNTETKEVTVTWTAPEGNITPTGYKLFIGDAEPLEVTALTYKHDVSALAPGEYEYEYCVLPVYATGVCEGTVAKECKKVPFEILGIKGYTTTFSIAPNPANDFIIIKAKGDFNNIEVLSFLGQVVLAQSNEGNSAKVDIANLTNGVYFVRITSDTGTSVQKFVKN